MYCLDPNEVDENIQIPIYKCFHDISFKHHQFIITTKTTNYKSTIINFLQNKIFFSKSISSAQRACARFNLLRRPFRKLIYIFVHHSIRNEAFILFNYLCAGSNFCLWIFRPQAVESPSRH